MDHYCGAKRSNGFLGVNIMDRRELFKQTCGMGLCACAGATVLAQVGLAADEVADDTAKQLHKLEWWQDHTRRQVARLWELMEERVDEPTRRGIIQELGRECAERLGWATKYQGKMPDYFQMMKDRLGEEIVYDEARGVITITTPERDCVCGLVDSKVTPGCFCDCSLGWQKYTYETMLGREVEVEVKESVLRGSKRCVFEVRIA